MKIAVMGTFTQANLESFLAQAFRDLGHEVAEFDAWGLKRPLWFHRQLFGLLSNAPVRIHHPYRQKYQAFVNAAASRFLADERPDFVIVHNGGELHPETIKAQTERRQIPFASFAADDPSLHAVLREYLPCLPYFTHVFASESALVPKIRLLTNKWVEFLPCGAPHNIYRRIIPPSAEQQLFDCNLGYVSGGMAGSPAGVYRALILNHVRDLGLKIFGDRHWHYIADQVPEIRPNIFVTGFLNPERMNAFFASTKIFMGIVHPQVLSGVGQRIFDAAAAGAFTLAEYKADIERLFPNGEIESFRSKEEMREKAIYYLEYPEKRREKAAAARTRVLSEHTWVHRARQILEMVFG